MKAQTVFAGQVFGRLTVLSTEVVGKRRYAEVACQCGTSKRIQADNLNTGTKSCGCHRRANSARMLAELNAVEVPKYRGMHLRVAKQRGNAKAHNCDCGKPAQEWAYDHDDPKALVVNHNGYDVSMSLDIQHYRPMCIPCHRAFDRKDG